MRYLKRLNGWALGYLDEGSLQVPTPVGWVTGAVLLIRASLFRALGGFDEHFFMNSEEVDLCARAWQSGSRVVYVPEAKVIHVGGASSSSAASLIWLAQGKARYLSKHYGAATLTLNQAMAVLFLLGSLPVWALRVALHRQPTRDAYCDMAAHVAALRAVLTE